MNTNEIPDEWFTFKTLAPSKTHTNNKEVMIEFYNTLLKYHTDIMMGSVMYGYSCKGIPPYKTGMFKAEDYKVEPKQVIEIKKPIKL